MKRIEATIDQYKLEAVKNAIQAIDRLRMTVTQVCDMGGETRTICYRGVTRMVESTPKIRVEIIVSNQKVEAVIAAILEHARTGSSNDGAIVVSDIDKVIRIHTGETEATEVETARQQVALTPATGEQHRWGSPSYQHSW